jgi:hypothetical protein
MNIFNTPTKQELEKLEFDMWIIHNTLHEETTIMVDKYPNIRQIETGYGEETMPDIKYFEGEQAIDDFYNEMNLDSDNIKLTNAIWSKDERQITLKINNQEYDLEVF